MENTMEPIFDVPLDLSELVFEVVYTGLDSSEGATALMVAYTSTTTIVVPHGEHQNCQPWLFLGRVDSKLVLDEYLASIGEKIS